MIFQGKKKIIFGVLFLFIAAASLCAGGVRDTVLKDAERLIEEKNYDEAIRLLSDYSREHPDRFGDAQKLFQRIVKIRGQFNDLADELLDILVHDPGNNDKILELSNRLMTLGSASDSSTQEFLDQVRELASFNANRNRLEQILADARLLLERNDFSGALASYASGLDIYQVDYFASGNDEEAKRVVRGGLDTINGGIAAFNALAPSFNAASLAFAGMTRDSSSGTVQAARDTLSPQMEQVAQIRRDLVSVEREYEVLFRRQQQQDPNLQDRSFLSFANRLVRGPAGQDEGMIGVLDRFWNLNVSDVEGTSAEFARQCYADAFDAMNSAAYDEALPLIASAEQYISVSMDFVDSWTAYLESAGISPVLLFNEPVAPQKAGDFLAYRTMDRALEFFRIARDIGIREKTFDYSPFSLWREGNIDAIAAVSMERATRGELAALAAEITGLEDSINAEITGYENTRDHAPDLPNTNAFAGPLQHYYQARTVAQNLGGYIRNQELETFVRQYTVSNQELLKEVNVREEEFAEGSRLAGGIARLIESDTEVIEYTYFYPQEGMDILTMMNQALAGNLVTARELLVQYDTEPAAITGTEEGRALYAEASGMLSRLRDLESQAVALIASAQTQVNLAAALRLEGDRLYQEAQAALGRSDFEFARNRLSLAQNRYSNSLAIQESETVRSQVDVRVIALGQEIVRLQNESIVREVRDYVTRARTLYYSGNFDQAEDLLVRAQNRWRTTNSTEDPEITYWINMTRNALSLSSGRTIPVTAPLYAEMSQLLSDARLNYDAGVRLISAGQRQEGLRRFGDARNMTQKVELMFPLNREARLLDLRIEQFTDPSAFNTVFRQRLNDAVAGTKPSVRSVESFAELQNLAEINPLYPGIQQILTQAEIDMDYRPPPPDPQALARSETLTRDSRPIVENRNNAMYEVALVWLNEALNLNPNNAQATLLKDALQIQMTGTGVIAIDTKSFDEYQRAITEFQRGNRYTAWVIVQELLRNPQNQKSTQIQELQRRIEASL